VLAADAVSDVHEETTSYSHNLAEAQAEAQKIIRANAG
jgi:hypothetical protein